MQPLCRDQDWPNLAHFGHNEPHRTLSPFASTPIFAGKQKQDAKPPISSYRFLIA
jgi:hypothetical protein